MWLAAEMPVNVTVPFVATGWFVFPSSVTVYPSGSTFDPVVLVDTVRSPVGGGVATQLTANDVEAVPPAGTPIVRDVPPLTVQFPATPDSTTVWLPAPSPVNVTLPFVGIARVVLPSSVSV